MRPVGGRGPAGSSILQRDPLEHLGLRRVAVDGLSQYVERMPPIRRIANCSRSRR